MKKTLLEIVQEILSDLDSDEVNSIDDTVEAEQVAGIVRSTYMAMMSTRNWPHLKRGIQLSGSGQLALPTHMTIAEDVKEIVFINYNISKDLETRRKYKRMRWLEPEEFLRRQNSLNNDNDNVDVIQDPTGIEILVRNDIAPSVYTSFDDETLVFDAYDTEAGETLIGAKVQAQAYVMPNWSHVDDAIPDLPEEAFTSLIEESKSTAAMRINQMVDQKAEQLSRKSEQWLSRKAWAVGGGIKFNQYGRKGSKGRTGTANATFKQGKY